MGRSAPHGDRPGRFAQWGHAVGTPQAKGPRRSSGGAERTYREAPDYQRSVTRVSPYAPLSSFPNTCASALTRAQPAVAPSCSPAAGE